MTTPAELFAMASVWRSLTEQDRAIFSAVRLEGLDYAEVAKRHGCTARDVEDAIARVLVAFDAAVARTKR